MYKAESLRPTDLHDFCPYSAQHVLQTLSNANVSPTVDMSVHRYNLRKTQQMLGNILTDNKKNIYIHFYLGVTAMEM